MNKSDTCSEVAISFNLYVWVAYVTRTMMQKLTNVAAMIVFSRTAAAAASDVVIHVQLP